jgi:cyclohexanecarboxylate-CoA ligase
VITSSPERIATLTNAGHWGTDTLHGLLARNAASVAQVAAVKDQPNRVELTGDKPLNLNWGELEIASENLAFQLQAQGIGEDDQVVVQLPNVVELLLLYYATSKIGAIISPLPVQYGSHELQAVAAALAPRAVITMERLRDTPIAENAKTALPQLPLLVFGRDLHVNSTVVEYPCERAPDDANRILTMCWTSGTTGTPKGVPRSHNMWMATGRCSAIAGDMVAEDVLLNPFPLVNMASLGGFVFPSALLGSGIVLHHPLDPPLFLQQIQDERVTFTIVPPALLNQLAKAPDMWDRYDFSALRRIGSGSAPLAPWMIETFGRDYGKEIVNFYGSNEGISLFSTPESAPDPEVRASMFRRPGNNDPIATRVANPETGEEITGAGERGELLINGATVFDGYHGHNDADLFSADGFFRTGDLVEICGEGDQYYRIVGRCKDIINRGGMKISPAELDIALDQHPSLVEAAVCAYPDERLGEKICACLVMQENVDALSIEAVQDFLLEQGFAKFKLPERVEVMERLPRNPLGKVQRFLLQEIVCLSNLQKD